MDALQGAPEQSLILGLRERVMRACDDDDVVARRGIMLEKAECFAQAALQAAANNGAAEAPADAQSEAIVVEAIRQRDNGDRPR